MKKYHLKSFVFIITITTILSCATSENAPSKKAPTIITSTISNITLNSASSGGNITNDGGDAITARGIVWNTSTSPTTSLATKTTDGTGLGNFSSNLTNLIPSSSYFIRAYATNGIGTGYGNELSFSTGAIVIPTVSTTAITGITTNSAVSGGNITADGGGTITARGVVWSTSQNPTVSLTTKTIDKSGLAIFISNSTNLAQNTTYYIKAYATNSAGTAYGNQVEFKTEVITSVTDVDGNVYKIVQIGSQLWMAENLKTTKYCNGDIIPNVNDYTQWKNLTTEGWSYYENDLTYNSIYGKLYNGYTIIDSRNVCPCEWHIPTRTEWIQLTNYLIANGFNYDGSNSENKIGKSIASKSLWTSGSQTPIIGDVGYDMQSNNRSGFNAFPSGFRSMYTNTYGGSQFNGLNNVTSFWGKENGLLNGNSVERQRPDFGNGDLYDLITYPELYKDGFSIRCVKN